MRVHWPGIAAAALGLFAASACGGSVPSGEGEESPGGGGDGGVVNVAAVWTGEEQESFQAVLDAFTQRTGIETQFKSTGDDIGTYLGSQVAGGDPPDVAILPQPGLLTSLAEEGNIEPLADEPAQNVQDHYAPYWIDLASHQDEQYGVYFKAANKSTWWYNTAAFETAGVQPPQNWNGMLDQASTVAASGVPYVAVGGADGWVLTDWFENIYLRRAGPDMYDRLAQHEIPWTHQSVTSALETFQELMTTSGAVMGGREGALETSFTDSVDAVLTQDPGAASVYEADFVPGVASATGLQTGADYSFFDFPSIDGSENMVVGGGDVAVTLTGSSQAQRLLAFLATPDAAKIWAERGGFTSPNLDMPLSAYPDDLSRESAEAVVEASEAGKFRFDMSDQAPPAFGGTEGRGLWQELQTFLRNPDNIEKVQQQLESDAEAAYGSSD